jgi:hypothetical protein
MLNFVDIGDGFGNNGTGGARVALDTEGLVLGDDDTYWISDEYGELCAGANQCFVLTSRSGIRLPVRQKGKDDYGYTHS